MNGKAYIKYTSDDDRGMIPYPDPRNVINLYETLRSWFFFLMKQYSAQVTTKSKLNACKKVCEKKIFEIDINNLKGIAAIRIQNRESKVSSIIFSEEKLSTQNYS